MGKAYFWSVEPPEASVPEKPGVIAMCMVCKSTAWQNSDYWSDLLQRINCLGDGGRRKKDNINLIATLNSYVKNVFSVIFHYFAGFLISLLELIFAYTQIKMIVIQ